MKNIIKNKFYLKEFNVQGYRGIKDCTIRFNEDKYSIHGDCDKSILYEALMNIEIILRNDYCPDRRYLRWNEYRTSKDYYASFSYKFMLNENEIEYSYLKNTEFEMISEKMYFNKNMIFNCLFDQRTIIMKDKYETEEKWLNSCNKINYCLINNFYDKYGKPIKTTNSFLKHMFDNMTTKDSIQKDVLTNFKKHIQEMKFIKI